MKKISVKAIPERLRACYFRDNENDIAEYEKFENARIKAFKAVFDEIMSGGASVAYWDDAPVVSVSGVSCVIRRVLHPSTRCDGLQLTTFHLINGEEIPTMHQTFETWEKHRFTMESGGLFNDYTITVF